VMRVDDYLGIPEDYGHWLGGLRWGDGGEVVEYAADDPEIGLTFAMAAEVALFLEGAAADGGLPHFGFVLHFLHLMGFGGRHISGGDTTRTAAHGGLARAFRETGRSLRNAGALCAVVCRGLSGVADPPRWATLRLRLTERSPSGFAILRQYPGEEPPLRPEEFDAWVRARLRDWHQDDLSHWLRHGRGPIPQAGEAIARALPIPLAQALAALEDRPRLRGMAGLVSHLNGALSLPPRSLAHAALPLGGYTDVTNRGLPERILPSQLALDPDEFLRRFASRELLYYDREEPHAPSARELVIVIDQGVRTWGDVRLVLAAAAVSLVRQADRRKLSIRLATTGNGGEPLDVSELGSGKLGELLESSDLSSNPAATLARALSLANEPGAARDFVLLTHPRSLAEPAVLAAANTAGGETRLFAVAVDPSGEVSLLEVRGRGPVEIGRCRVDLTDARAGREREPATTAHGKASKRRWQGDIEPIGFPFTFGALAPFDDSHFTFDEAGEWLLLVGGRGLLHAWRIDGSGSEMLPRAMVEGQVLDTVHSVIGVAGGFVVAGTAGHLSIAAHYDWASRTCTAHELDLDSGVRLRWSYLRRLHSIVGVGGQISSFAIDLGQRGPRARIRPGDPFALRATDALFSVSQSDQEPLIIRDGEIPPRIGRVILPFKESGEVAIRDLSGEWSRHVPLSEGRPMLEGGLLVQVRWNGGTLALLIESKNGRILHLFEVTQTWRSLGEHICPRDMIDFALSRDGSHVAWRYGDRQLVCQAVGGDGPPSLMTPKGRAHSELGLELGYDFLTINAGRHLHLVRWDRGRLEFVRSGGYDDTLVERTFGVLPPQLKASSTRTRHDSLSDRQRFHLFAVMPPLTAAVDRFGQVALLDRSGEVVCMFLVFRDQIAAWAPDGTRVGPVSMNGGPPTPGGEERIAAALLAAEEDGTRAPR
jgi:hypothetical protein